MKPVGSAFTIHNQINGYESEDKTESIDEVDELLVDKKIKTWSKQ